MPAIVNAVRRGLSSLIGQFRRVYQDPMEVEGGSLLGQQPYYNLLWKYYDNSAFEDIRIWSSYRGQYRLYRQMRTLYNPTRRLCDFYATHLYPGVLTAFPESVPSGTQIAIPLPKDAPPEVRTALDQLWSWSNWHVMKSVLTRYGAVAGNVLVEAVDDVDAGRVYAHVIWPGLITYLDLDPTGVVLAYVLQYPARNDDGTYYEYRKEVDSGEIRFYKDDELFDYGEGASYANPYGFVPAVWVKHKDLGGNTGAPAMHGSVGKIDELNSLASHIHDQIHKVIGAPVVMWSDGSPARLGSAEGQQKRTATQATDSTDLDREGLLMLIGPSGGRIDSLAGQLQLHEAAEHLSMLQTEIEADHPEVTMYRQLRSMSQVTGPAALRLMGDVAAALTEAAANYDAGCARVFAMCLAIGGWRLANGDWGTPRADQAVFAPFTLARFHAGDIQIRILPRPLIATDEAEQLQLEQLRQSVRAATQAQVTENLRATLPD